jgi:hypothetical protein
MAAMRPVRASPSSHSPPIAYPPPMAEIECIECGYRVNILRTGPHSAKPEHDYDEFQRLCREGPFRYITGTGCAKLDATYLAASRRGEF